MKLRGPIAASAATAFLLAAGQAHALSTPFPATPTPVALTPTPPPPTATPVPLPTREQTADIAVQCKFPLIGTRTATLQVGTFLPDPVPLNKQYDARIGFSLLFNGSSGLTGGAARFVDGSLRFVLSTATPNDEPWSTTGGALVAPTHYFDGSEQVAIGGTSGIPIYPIASGEYVLRQEAIDLNLVAYSDEQRTSVVTLPPASTDVDGNPVADSDGNPNTFDVRCKLPADPAARRIGAFNAGGPATPTPITTNTPTPVVELTPTPLAPTPTPGGDPYLARPTTPGISADATDADVTSISVLVRWKPSSASSSQAPVTGYVVTVNGNAQPDPGPTDRLLLSGLRPDTDYQVTIAGHTYYAVSDPLTLNFRTKPSGGATPTPTPTRTPVPEESPRPVFTPSPFPRTPVPSPVPTLIPNPVTPVPTGPPSAQFSYGLQGSTTLATLTKGTLPLTGSVDASLVLATGDFTADLKLNDTQGRLTALGFLPVTATVGFVTSGPTTGKLVDDQLTTNSKVRIKVKSVKAFGAIPLAGGNTCQTKALSDISLKSTDSFDPTTRGGTIGGSYAISDLNGCGPLNGLVSPITAGKGNTISLKLTPKPAA